MSTFADVWIEAERKVLEKIGAAQAGLDKVQVGKTHQNQMRANENNFRQAGNQAQQNQKMLIFRVVEAKGFSTGPQCNFEVAVKDRSSGIISLAQFAQEKFAL